MQNSKKTHNIADQSNKSVRKSQKHDANLQKNSSLYFQIGLILCLLASYGLFEMKFENKIDDPIGSVGDRPDDDLVDMKNYVPEQTVVKKEVKKKEEPKILGDNPIIDKDDSPIKETDHVLTEPVPTSDVIDASTFESVDKPDDDIEDIFNMTNVEIVPIYPGCEDKTNNQDRLKCMSEKLGRLIQRKFDTDLAGELGLRGRQKIDVQFKIDKQGKVTDVKARAPHPQLENEAKRLTAKIPIMEPGLQRAKPVSVIYNLPIVFQVQN